MKQLCKFLHLKTSDRQLLIIAFALLLAVRLALWLLPFSTWHRLLARLKQAKANLQQAESISTGEVVWAISIASNYMPGGVKCLARALATQVLLSWLGHAAEFRIGVAKGEAGQLEAHAWVESQGQVVIGALGNLSRFTPLPAFGGNKR
jgi:hypothetical protein